MTVACRRPGSGGDLATTANRRAGFGLIEALFGLALLAAGAAALFTLGSAETRGLEMSLERFLASQALEELEAAFGSRTRAFYRREGFPADAASHNALHDTILEEHPLVTPLGDFPALPPGPRAELQAAWRAADLRRVVTYQEATDAAGRTLGRVGIEVRFRDRAGRTRRLRAARVIR